MITEWKNKKVGILGCGVEGVSTAKYLQKKGAEIWVLDKKKKAHIEQRFVTELEAIGVQFSLGEAYLENLSQFAVIVRSPGIKRANPELLQAEKDGVLITSQTNLFFELCPCPIIGVTGTKGKGTTASLIHTMLKAAGKDAYLGGNIGTPPLEFLENLTKESQVVLELSSFQLQDLEKSPHIAVMLMVTSEHLDYHTDIAEYVDAKRNILRFQKATDFAILNRDYLATNESDVETVGKVFFVSREREVAEGCFIKDGGIWIRSTVGSTLVTNDGVPREKKIIEIEDILLPGKHNLENICAAVMASTIAGVSKEAIVSTLRTFTGLEHRLELVRELDGVKYYDDSFSTTPETAIAGIEAFTAPEILILGGSSKKSDFSELGKVLRNAKHIKAIIGIGDEWFTIKEQMGTVSADLLIIEDAQDMQTIVAAAAKIATSGDVVLLSPACASFGMFQNYKDRGEQFKKEVMGLA
jgi:UDP-N-acetylmuramoylalanine--D-glutamate ligase